MGARSTRTIQTRGAAVRISESGSGEPACVFLYYWGGSGRTWDGVIDRIDGRAHCVAVDQRGWGESIATDGRYDLGAMADDFQGVVAALGLQRYVLIGHSMGGNVAQIVAARRPIALLGLVLVAPAPPAPMPIPEAQRGAMLASYRSREGVQQALTVAAADPGPVPMPVQAFLRPARRARRSDQLARSDGCWKAEDTPKCDALWKRRSGGCRAMSPEHQPVWPAAGSSTPLVPRRPGAVGPRPAGRGDRRCGQRPAAPRAGPSAPPRAAAA